VFIDAHSHLGVRHGASQTGAELVAKLDKAGVDKAAVFPFVEGEFSNDVIVEAVTQFPDRLIPYAALNPWRGQAAVDELESLAAQGFRGLKVHPTIHGYHLSDLGLMGPIMETLRAHRMVLISHGASDLYNAPPEFGRLAKAFPDVPIMAAHSGTFWSHDQAIEIAAENDNLYLETARVPVYEVTLSIRELGAEKVVWGTDSPYVDYEFEFGKMRRTVRSDGEHALVCGGNLARLLGL
jgi:predicted TIM-barrel fold metal-dependent hydrolase